MREEQGVGEVGCLGPLLDPTKGETIVSHGAVELKKIENPVKVTKVDRLVNF